MLNSASHVVHACAGARKLLNLATMDSSIPSLCAALHEASSSVGRIVEHHNAWGRFTLRAQRLLPSSLDDPPVVAVTVTHDEALVLKLFRRCEKLNLPPRQLEIAMRLAHGDTYEAIAKSRRVSAHTVIDHARKLYEKFNVHSRSELVAKLLAV